MGKKKKILFHSNCSRILTGFGKNARNVLSYLYKTGKYEIVEAANGVREDSSLLKLFPWKCVGTFPADSEIESEAKTNNALKSKAGYGLLTIDSIIENEKPDIFIGAEDIWAFNGFWDNAKIQPEPGQQIRVWIEAQDNYVDGTHLTRSNDFTVTVITAQEYRTMLVQRLQETVDPAAELILDVRSSKRKLQKIDKQ